MSINNAADYTIGGSSSDSGYDALVSLSDAAGSTLSAMRAQWERAKEAHQRAQIEDRMRQIEALQNELREGQNAILRVAENAKKWNLKAKCKVLEQRASQLSARMKLSDGGKEPHLEISPNLAGATIEQLGDEVERLRLEIGNKEGQLRAAVTSELESFAANQGVGKAIDDLLDLPPPVSERPVDLIRYVEQAARIQAKRSTADAIAAMGRQLVGIFETLPHTLSEPALKKIESEVRQFGRITKESDATVKFRTIIGLIEVAKQEAARLQPLLNRLAEARKEVGSPAFARLPEDQQRMLADESAMPSEDQMAHIEKSIAEAKKAATVKFAGQRDRLARAALLDTLRDLDYETSWVDEAMWQKHGSLFISRRDWGDFVVRLTMGEKKMRLYAGRYTKDGKPQIASSEAEEGQYKQRIREWCDQRLPTLKHALGIRNVTLDPEILDSEDTKLQWIAPSDVGTEFANVIERHADQTGEGKVLKTGELPI